MRALALFLAVPLALLGAGAQGAPADVIPLNHLPAISGDYFPLESKETGVTYHIYVRYPQGYADDPGKRFPIVYLLDGDSTFPLLAAQHLFLTIDDKLPEAIVVGIAYGAFDPAVNKRDVDFGPRAEAFHRFLDTELLPRVEGQTRADPERRILVGQSFGGAMVLWSAVHRPDTFWGRLASNPSFRLSADKLSERGTTPRRRDLRTIVVSGTANTPEPRKQAIAWVNERNRSQGAMSFERIDIRDGTHAADLPAAYRLALRQLFDWKSPGPNKF
jgi:predicted alpha/beta superfamily hydrolase